MMNKRQFIKAGVLLPLFSSTFCVAKNRPHIVVVGGGYGGVSVARQLRILMPNARITLIERNAYFVSHTLSSLALIGEQPLDILRYRYDALERYGIQILHANALRVNTGFVELEGGNQIRFDRCVLSPGISLDYENMLGYSIEESEKIPHAWYGDRQIKILQQQLLDMRKNGTVIIIPPSSPSRCSPAPYERASMIAYWMEKYHPKGKIIILDPKEIFAQQTLFDEAWTAYYRDRIEWRSGDLGGLVEAIDGEKREVLTEFGKEKADVINYIPLQRAGEIAYRSNLTDDSGWCLVDGRTMESLKLSGIYIIGDAIKFDFMPKAGTLASAQGQVAAEAIVKGLGVNPTLSTEALSYSCYSYITPDHAFFEKGVYKTGKILEKKESTLYPESVNDPNRKKSAFEGIQSSKIFMNRLFQ